VNKLSREPLGAPDLRIGRLPPPLPPRLPSDQGAPIRNRILLGLSPADRGRLLRTLEPITFALGDVVCEPGVRSEHIYFPTTAVVSSLYTMEDGTTMEMGLAGNDGVVGVSLFLGGDTTPHRDVVVVAGHALMMRARTLREEFAAGGALQGLLLRYTHALITQISQTAACNRLHAAQQRLCRWLLMCHDRVETNDLQMTQEFISTMLGGRRETVTVAARRLQEAGLIRYARGQITILDRKGLEATVCECYTVNGHNRDHLRTTQVLPRRVVKATLVG
jgi:CRP-like cAMP-binding protein